MSDETKKPTPPIGYETWLDATLVAPNTTWIFHNQDDVTPKEALRYCRAELSKLRTRLAALEAVAEAAETMVDESLPILDSHFTVEQCRATLRSVGQWNVAKSALDALRAALSAAGAQRAGGEGL